jgi:type IIS restriction enzyme
MNKNAIKKFAIDARNKLIASVTDKAGMIGITSDNCSEAITKGADFEVYKTAAGTEVTLNKKQCGQRRKLVDQIRARGFEAVVEEVAYTWFNRICAIRFMEVNDYMYPVRVRVLSSEKKSTVSGLVKNEPDVVTMAPDIDWDFTDKEREEIIDAKMNNRLDDLFRMLFIKQCNLLHEVLPGLFEETEDYTEMLLNISFTNEDDVIRMLVDGIDENDFNITTVDKDGKSAGQVEIIGWLYQYYNTEPKNKAFAKKGKITKEEVPAVTQLFTPDWIVRYMVENSLGRMWVEGHPDEELKSKWKYYLDEAKQEEYVQQELNKIKAEYATLKPEDIKLIDPCMGSGHILVYAFDVFMQIYENAGWSQRDAAQSIIQNNIYGLDIDDRAAQLSYFAVLMKARQYDRRILTRGIEPNVYAVQESNGINRGQLKYFGTGLTDTEKNVAVSQMEGLLNTLNDAKEYGSLLNVEDYDWELLDKFVENTDTESQISFDTFGLDETAEQLKQLIRIGRVMAQRYEVVATNPPYAGTSNLSAKVNDFVKKNYPDSKADLFAVFIERCGEMLKKNGYQAMITQHSWMFIGSFETLRNKMLNCTLISMVHLGIKAFEEIGNDVVQTCSFIYQKNKSNNYFTKFVRLVEYKSYSEKEKEFFNSHNRMNSKCVRFGNIPGIPYAYYVSDSFIDNFQNAKYIEDYGKLTGSQNITGDNEKYLRLFWEVEKEKVGNEWRLYAKGGDYRQYYGNLSYVVNWSEQARKFYVTNKTSNLLAEEFWYKEGITYSAITSRGTGFRYLPKGCIFDKGGPSINLSSKKDEVLALLNSNVAKYYFWVFNPSINLQIKDVKSFPIILPELEEIKKLANENIDCCKRDWDSYETSWDYKIHPLVENALSKALSEKFAEWEKECDNRIKTLITNETELNKIFINAYGLENEVTPDVEERDVTVHKADLQRDIKSLISYAVGCMFGRYSIYQEGLMYAGGMWDYSKYKDAAWRAEGRPDVSDFYTTLHYMPDFDNIIPITDEEYFTDDIVGLFEDFIKEVYGKDTLEKNLSFVAKALGNKGNTSREVIRNYFLNDFFKDHCNTYSVTGSGKRPIYWLFDSGKQNGFKALIYMHRYDADTVGRVRTDYLHKAQKYVETAMQSAQYTIDNATSASEKSKATKAVTKYTKQLAEMRIYDEAIAHVANQRIEIDLDDGVKVNYAKFQGVEVAQEGKKALKIDLLAKI